jgi:hypothetical protein
VVIVAGLGEGLGLAQHHQDASSVAKGIERRAQREPEIDGLLVCVARLRQMCMGTERLLVGPDGLTVGRPRQGLRPGLPAVAHGFVPPLAQEGMVGEPFDVLEQPVRVQPFEGVDDLCVDGAPPRAQETRVGHLLGERVGERVFLLGDEAGLIEQFGGLHVSQTLRKSILGHLTDGLQQVD